MADMNRVLGLCNLYNCPRIGSLNSNRALGTVTFTGRYALMDFALSNFTNSHIDKVGILVKQFPSSVLSHLSGGRPWIRNTKTGREFIYYNEYEDPASKRNTAINNLAVNKGNLFNDGIDYVVIAPSNFIMSMDFRPILDAHIASKCGITMVYAPIHDGKTLFSNADVIKLNKDGTVSSFNKNNRKKDEVLCFVETYVINKDILQDMIERKDLGTEATIKSYIKDMIQKENFRVNSFAFEHFVLPITSFNEYVSSSFRMLRHDTRKKLFRPEWPIYTTTHDTPPVKYGPNAVISDSTIANGCKINGTVEHSILARKVVVEEGAVVKNCILFTGTYVGKNTVIDGLITDKKVRIPGGKTITRDIENYPTVITENTEF